MSDNIDAPFALGAFASPGGGAFAAVVVQGRAYPLESLGMLWLKGSTIRELLEDWDGNFQALDKAAPALAADKNLKSYALEDLKALPPVEPRQIFCTGANYKKHVADLGAAQPPPGDESSTYEERWAKTYAMMEERARNGRPYAFVKLPSCLAGAEDEIILPKDVEQPDW